MKRGIDEKTGAEMFTPGVDYSYGLPMADGRIPNTDSKTGIRYGVIHQNNVLQAWADASEAYYPCEHCEKEDEECNDMCDPTSWYVDDGEYLAECSEDGDIFVMRSPFFTYAQFCSPCAPGACYLMNPCDEENIGNKCYCFGEDWFDEDLPCPYPIWSVETGVLVYSPKAE